ncbi:MAG: hypothetical protein GX868_15565 [Actinobacteria bacterium]|nr:hypothetical protein [Actinomycetota bacterium]
MRNRGKITIGVALSVALIIGACSGTADDSASGGASGGGETSAVGNAAGEEATSGFAERSLRYLATAAEVEPSADNSRAKVWRAVAQLATGDGPVALSVADLDTITRRIAEFTDTTDFDMIALINLWYRSDFGERLAADTADHVRSLMVGFKYWYTEPQPEGIVDERWYWSENHQILFHTIEYLAGQALPEATFTNDGRTGAEHAAHAEALIRRWVEQRARYGFSEWYSNVYYSEDLEALVALAEFAQEPDIATLGAIGADLVLYDIAGHTLRGAFGVTHGRSYKKDKMTALDEDTWDVSKLVFDSATEDHQSQLSAVFLASATKYRPPAVLAEVLRDFGEAPTPADVGGTVELARHSLELDPLVPVTDDPDGPMGLAFDAPENLMTWWAMAAMTPWQTVVESTSEMTTYNMWEAKLFSPFKPFEGIVKNSTPDTIRQLASSLAPVINIGLLSEANTYTWRSENAMLSTAQDYRKGQASQQHHIWQATLGPNAQVFTTHPRTATEPGTKWHSNTDDWTSNGALPRSVQHRNVNITMYAPLFASSEHLQGGYQDYTHAYFPQEHFDEVISVGNWTIGRLDDTYLALWSWRPTRWQVYDPAEFDTNGLTEPFELVADGGPNNVWITELGTAATHGTFDGFVEAITGNEPAVTPLGDPAVFSTGFDVAWTSPTQGPITVGWDAPLVVAGTEQALRGYPRVDAPWAQVPFDSTSYVIAGGKHRLRLDVTAPERDSTGGL